MDKLDRMKQFAMMHAKVRDKAGKSQEFIAAELGVSKKTVQNWEKGVSSPNFFQSLEWFRVLNTNPFPYYFTIVFPDNLRNSQADVEAQKVNEEFFCFIRSVISV